MSSVIQLKYVCVVHSSDVLCGNIVPNPLLWKSFVKRMFLDFSSGLVWSFWTSHRTHYPAGRFWLSFTSRMEVMEEFCKKSRLKECFGRLIELIILLAGFGYPLLQGWKLWKSFVKSRLKECF